MKADEKTKRTPKQGTKRSPETIEERVHRHLSDINSKITDEDIKSVRTELDIRKRPAEQESPAKQTATKRGKNKSRRAKKDNDKPSGEKKTTSWDMLSEGYD